VDLVRSIGADEVIDYTREDFTDGTRRWDVIVDTAGRRPVRVLSRALTKGGTLVIVGQGGGDWTGGFFRQILRAPILSLFTGKRLRPVTSKVRYEDLQALAELIEAGTVTPVVGKTYPLNEALEAVRYLAEGHARGKVVITG
jgi:NADPH:quinone reductase-like Zn-dependent oxidoreductase